MDFLNKAYTQVAGVFQSMTLTSRITTALLLVAIVVSLGFLFQQQAGTGGDWYLFGGEVLTSSDIHMIEGAFAKAQLNSWEVDGNRIRVPRSQKAAYIAAIMDDKAYPDTPGSAWQRMFSGDNPFKSKQMRDLEAMRALEGSLATTIREMNNIETATVLIEERDVGEFPRKSERHAAVSVKAFGNESISPNAIDSIRILVASGGGMERHNVTVVDLNTSETHEAFDDEGQKLDNLYAKHQQNYERRMEQKLQRLLNNYRGIKVTVHATLDDKLANNEQEVTYTKPTALETRETSKETTSSRPSPGGRPGYVPNNSPGMSPQSVATAGAENTSTERSEESKFVSGMTVKQIDTVGLKPTDMHVTIMISRQHFLDVWNQQNSVAEGSDPVEPDQAALETIEKAVTRDIQNAVTGQLPMVVQGEDPFPRVQVIPYTETKLPLPDGPPMTATATRWLSVNWPTLGMFGMALVGVFVLRGMVRSTQTGVAASEARSDAPPQAERLAGLGDASGLGDSSDDEEELANSLKARFDTSSRSLRDELTELVREDPVAAASVLQIWIGEET